MIFFVIEKNETSFFFTHFFYIYINLFYFKSSEGIPTRIVQQYDDNMRWLSEAEKHKMVVGSQARILYSDQVGRARLALAFNKAVKDGTLKVSQKFLHFLNIMIMTVIFIPFFAKKKVSRDNQQGSS